MNSGFRILISVIVMIFLGRLISVQAQSKEDELAVFSEKESIIEIGSHLCGLEFHHSKAVPQRISFYYPVANSIDNSQDYWTRDSSHAMSVVLSVAGKSISLEDLVYTTLTTPYSASFSTEFMNHKIQIEYNFPDKYSAFIVDVTIRNISGIDSEINLSTYLSPSLRSCHSYNSFWPTNVRYFKNTSDFIFEYPQVDLGKCGVYYLGLNDSQSINETTSGNKVKYSAKLNSKEDVNISFIVGCTKYEEICKVIDEIKEKRSIKRDDFKNSVLAKIASAPSFKTGDKYLDHSVLWAKSMLEANRHYIDGDTILMPCPAEYNFFFTHDVLVSDLAIVKFNPSRVKEDLLYIVRHANSENVIPHAYYWKDSTFVTEYSGMDNWNHFWFVILSSTYLRHSGDLDFAKSIYPLVEKSINTVLENKVVDGLVYSHRPDWWDAGDNVGPRSYMTILAARAIEEFIYLSISTGNSNSHITELCQISADLKKNLVKKLWDTDKNYLMNYLDDGSKDEHYYMGSILASHYNMLSDSLGALQLESVKKNLLDPSLGVYNIYPMDVHMLINELGLVGDEAGAEGYYFNGGIWSQANAFYALALIKLDKREEAFEFVKKNQTVYGNASSPNGQPAMYEYRVSTGENYGKIDKPNFSWGAAWYLYTLYNLYGTKESIWNVTLSPYLNEEINECTFNLFTYGKNLTVSMNGTGNLCERISFDNKQYNSLVLSENIKTERIDIKLGIPSSPYLSDLSAKLNDCSWQPEKNLLSVHFVGILGKEKVFKIISERKLDHIESGGEIVRNYKITERNKNVYEMLITLSADNRSDELEIYFLSN